MSHLSPAPASPPHSLHATHLPRGNTWSPENVYTDSEGLHLTISPISTGVCDAWSCAEVWTNRPLGYGVYNTQVTVPSHLVDSAVFGIFVWDDDVGPGSG